MSTIHTPLPVHAARNSPPLLSMLAVAAGMAAAFIALFTTVGLGSKFNEIFSDFGVNLSPLTMRLMQFTRWLSGSGAGSSMPVWTLVLVGMCIAAVVLYRMCLFPRTRVAAGWIGLVILLLSLLYMLFAVIATWAHLTAMISSLKGSA